MFLSLNDKNEILKHLQNNTKTWKQLAEIYGVHKSTITHIKKQEKLISKFVQERSEVHGRKTLKKAEFPRMEKASYQWFIKQRKYHYPISSQILREKAKLFHQKYYPNTNFNAS